jgi:hypothetical protein
LDHDREKMGTGFPKRSCSNERIERDDFRNNVISLQGENELSEKSTMRRSQRLIAAAVAVALCSVLAGCGGGGLSNFDPSDLLDFLDTKKKLPGERKPVFPDGVPGLEQGVPKELYKGSRQEQIDQQNAEAAAAAAAPPPAEPKSKGASKSKAKVSKQSPATASTAPAAEPAAAADPDAAAAPEEEGAPAVVPPAPKPKKIARKRTTAPPSDQPAQPAAQSAAPAESTQQSAAPFPAPMPSGSFSR